MSDRDGYEPGVPCWITVMQPDPAAGAAFYGEVFGWQVEREDEYFIGRIRGREVAAIAPLPPGIDPPPPPDWVTHVAVDSADDAAEKAVAAGGSVVAGPYDWPTGRMAVIADPAGAVICALQPGRRKGAEVVNEPGAWSMSRLDTPDPEGAADFYGSVFGWTTETFDLGETSITMFRVPGYVGGEPEQPVSREVVATMSAVAGDVPAHWAVDFWVDDVDAAAAKAEELNGKAEVPPFDIPIGRTAVLTDPSGVAFSVSRMNGR